jgi:hypothetical protein
MTRACWVKRLRRNEHPSFFLAVAAPLQAGLLTKKRLHQGTGLVLVNINRPPDGSLLVVSKPYYKIYTSAAKFLAQALQL